MYNTHDDEYQAIIKVIGVGGGGGNAIAHMMTKKIEDVSFCATNTDSQALKTIELLYQNIIKQQDYNFDYEGIRLGEHLTKGLGAGAKPDIGREAVHENIEDIRDYLKGTDMVFITAGMGGGTGTGAIPVISAIAKEMGILTVAVVTTPFGFEGKKRMKYATEGLELLEKSVDSLIVIPNNKLLSIFGSSVSLKDVFQNVNDVLYNAVHSISDLITTTGLINVDFADVKTVMSNTGMGLMGTGIASGENRAVNASDLALKSPLLDHINVKGASGILINVLSSSNINIGEFNAVGEYVKEAIGYDEDYDNVTIVIGSTIDEDMGEDMQVTLIATNITPGRERETVVSKNDKETRKRIKERNNGYESRRQKDPYTEVSESLYRETEYGEEPYLKEEHYGFRENMRRWRGKNLKERFSCGDISRKSDDELDIPAFLRRRSN